MGASSHVKLLRDENDPHHQRMAGAIEALRDAGIDDLPQELKDYFGIYEVGEYREGETGLEVKGPDGCVTAYNAEMEEGFDIHVDKLPQGVKKIRAYTSY
jgi:hypothetical protein